MYQLGPRRRWPPRKRTVLIILGGIVVLALVAVLIYQIPNVQDYVDWRLDDLRARIKYAISPPEEAVFAPDPTLIAMVEETIAAFTPTATSTATVSPTPGATSTPEHTSTPVPTATPIPERVHLSGIRHESLLTDRSCVSSCPYAECMAKTTYGCIGVKVWIYRGEVKDDRRGQTYTAGGAK